MAVNDVGVKVMGSAHHSVASDNGTPPSVQSAEEYHRMLFFQLVDNILESINSRLHQKNIQFYVDDEELILSSANKPTESPEDRAAFARLIASE